MKTSCPDANHTLRPTVTAEPTNSPPGPDPPGLTAAWRPSVLLPAAAATVVARLLLVLLVPNQVKVTEWQYCHKILHK
jgi:hypothetical protein